MKVRLDWEVVREGETIAPEARRDRLARLRRVPHWAWYATLAVLVTCLLAGTLRVRQRYRETQRLVSFQIQSVIDLEARAFARGDRDLFLAQQDEAARRWYVRQKQRVRGDCWRIPPGQAAQWDPCAPVLPAKVNHVDLRGDIAWVEVVEGKPPVRRIRFYRQTGRGWVHTAPQESFWGKEVTLHADRFVGKYHKRDEPYVNAYLARIQEITDHVCGALECPPASTLEVDFAIDTPAYDAPYLLPEEQPPDSDTLLFSSPWQSGISIDGEAPAAQIDRLSHWATYAIAAWAIRSSSGQDLNHLQKALLDEYASWHVSQDPGQAPILGRIIERHGVEALPEVLRSVREARTLTALMARWLSLDVSDGQSRYFEALLNIEREALLVGRRETFMLLQHQAYPWWMSDQRLLFERWQPRGQALDSPAIRVRRVERIGSRARVALEDPSRSLEGYPPVAKSVVYLEYVDGDWKHASPFSAAMFWGFLAERRPAGTVTPTRTPTPARTPARGPDL